MSKDIEDLTSCDFYKDIHYARTPTEPMMPTLSKRSVQYGFVSVVNFSSYRY